MEKKLKKSALFKTIIILSTLCVIGYILRIYRLDGSFLFAYDQARDMKRIYEMIYFKDIKLVGPETDIQGVFNGPLYYYILLPLYYFFNFNPSKVIYFFALCNVVSGVFLLYFFGRLLTKILKSAFWQAFFGLYL